MTGDATRDIRTYLARRVVPVGGSRHGLVIGIEQYKDSRLNLRCATADAKAIYDLMVDPDCGMFPKDHVQLLLNDLATRENIWRALSSLRRSTGENDTVWIYYAGHGAPEESNLYWVTYDADVDDLYGTGLSNDQISKALSDIRAKRLLVLLDCCHAAATAVQKNPTRTVLTAEEVFSCYKGHGRVTLSSSDGKEKSVELGDVGHGAFSYFLEKGLRGEADKDGDGVVTADELWQYLHSKVKDASQKAGNRQTPMLLGEMTHDLALTLNPIATEKKRVMAGRLLQLVGLGNDQLSTPEARFCLRLLLKGSTSSYKGILDDLESVLSGQMRVSSFKRIIKGITSQQKHSHADLSNHHGIQGESTVDVQLTPSFSVKPPPEVQNNVPMDSERYKRNTNALKIAILSLVGGLLLILITITLFSGYDNRRIIHKAEMLALSGEIDQAKEVLTTCGWLMAGRKTTLLEDMGKRFTREADSLINLKEYAKAIEKFRLAAKCSSTPHVYDLRIEELTKLMIPKEPQRPVAEKQQVAKVVTSPKPETSTVGQPQDQVKWRKLMDSARKAEQAGKLAEAVGYYATLYQDPARPLQNGKIVWSTTSSSQMNQQLPVYVEGLMYYHGEGVPKDLSKSARLLEQAAQAGYSEAMFCLGVLYKHGLGVPTDITKGFEWYRKAAEAGSMSAMHNLGVSYQNGEGVTKNSAEAFKWFSQAADKGSIESMGLAAMLIFNGADGVPKDYQKALLWNTKAAEAGDVESMFALGMMYTHGKGVTINLERASEWYKKAAAEGHVDSMYNLGVLYFKGDGVTQDYAEAASWHRKAAEKGHGGSMGYLGNFYYEGRGVLKNDSTAFQWWKRGAEAGDGTAMKMLSQCYQMGVGTAKDSERASYWAQKAKMSE